MRQWRNFCWLWETSLGVRLQIFVSGVLGILRVVCGLGFIYISKELIDVATGTKQGLPERYAVWLIVLMLGSIVCNSLQGCITSPMEVTVQNALREQLFGRLLHSRELGSATLHTGDIQSRLGVDVRRVSSLLAISVPLLLINSVQLIASFLFLERLDSRLAYVVMIGLVLFLPVGEIYAKRMRKLTHQVRRGESAIQSLTQESIQHRIVIKTLAQIETMGNRLAVLQSSLLRMEKQRTHCSVFSRTLFSCGFSGCYLFIFVWGAVQLQEGLISVGVMTAFLQLVGQVQRPIVDLMRQFPSFITTMTSVERLSELELLECEKQGQPLLLGDGVGLRLRDVCFGYDHHPVLKDFSYDFVPGSVTAILGQSGVGKTTLIRLMLSLLNPQKGKLILYNRTQEMEVTVQTRENFIYVPQGNTLFSGTIRENLLMGNPHADEQQIRSALYGAAAEFVHTLPLGLDTLCAEQGAGLSEGQAQRIAIARSLLRSGSILLLDEITSALDQETEMLLIRRLNRYVGVKTIIFITHREKISNMCDTVLLPFIQKSY